MATRILVGDCRDVLRGLPDESVHCVVTSPPYWGLRDYGTAKWEGGDPACDHRSPSRFDYPFNAGLGPTGVQTQASNAGSASPAQQFRGICGKCKARRIDNQIGLEPTLAEYVETMRTVFADVRRVLRKDGTLWLNLGDSYAGGLKSKDLCGVPWRVAFALQADGWYLRQDIIWAKPNPMPESVRDRCTKSHEYLFLLSRSEKYHYDADAITEAVVADEETQRTKNKTRNEQRGKGDQDGIYHGRGDAAPFSNWKPFRNRRSVWGIATFPFSEAHFATFPPALIEPCMLAGCPKQCCAKCGAPWVRETSTEFVKLADRRPTRKAVQPNADMADINSHNVMGFNRVTTLGWSPSCSCNASTVPGTVLDPFGGAGTTGLVADRLGRNAILIELNPEYAEMAERRIRGDGGMFAQVAREPAVSSVGY